MMPETGDKRGKNQSMRQDVLLAICTCPERSVALKIAETLVEEGLAACVNLLAGIESVYSWKGKTERDSEVMLLVKTVDDRFEAMSGRVRELHPYDLPEIIAIPVSHGLTDYLQWVRTCTSDDS
jgi:periplasmic divalent cation tolerance protein